MLVLGVKIRVSRRLIQPLNRACNPESFVYQTKAKSPYDSGTLIANWWTLADINLVTHKTILSVFMSDCFNPWIVRVGCETGAFSWLMKTTTANTFWN
jgi:hypothetical protein